MILCALVASGCPRADDTGGGDELGKAFVDKHVPLLKAKIDHIKACGEKAKAAPSPVEKEEITVKDMALEVDNGKVLELQNTLVLGLDEFENLAKPPYAEIRPDFFRRPLLEMVAFVAAPEFSDYDKLTADNKIMEGATTPEECFFIQAGASKTLQRVEYLIVHRTIRYVKAQLDLEKRTFTPATWEGDGLVYRIDDETRVGSFRFRAAITDDVDVSFQRTMTKEDAMAAIRVDLQTKVKAAFIARFEALTAGGRVAAPEGNQGRQSRERRAEEPK
jgi:hypothetical protein